jgi:hypothetical protein
VESTLALRISKEEGVQATIELLVAASTERCDLTSVATARQGAALDLSYRIRLRAGYLPSALVAELHRLKGVESVDLRRES